jgi:hypothetical protein
MTKLQSGHKCVPSNSSFENEYIRTKSVTLTLKVGTWVLDSTRRLHVVDVYGYFKNLPCMTKLQFGHECVYL